MLKKKIIVGKKAFLNPFFFAKCQEDCEATLKAKTFAERKCCEIFLATFSVLQYFLYLIKTCNSDSIAMLGTKGLELENRSI